MYTIFILAAAFAPGQVQFFPDQPAQEPAGKAPAAKPASNIDARKETRDQVLRAVGPECLAFTRHYGDLGIYALKQCRPETGKNLVKLFNSGDLDRLKNPRAALQAVRQHGDAAAAWIVEHHEQLVDPDALECWCREPMEYVYDLKDIEQQAIQLRASRKYPPWLANLMADGNMAYIVMGVLALLFLVVAYRRKRRPAAPPAP